MISARLKPASGPDDALAQRYGEPRGKTECWYALDAKAGAAVALGIRAGVTLEQVKQGVEDQSLESLLNMIPVEKGDMLFVDAGTVHAMGPGVVILETQQTSDLTYRMYDYGRPRELHLEKSFAAMRLVTPLRAVQMLFVSEGRIGISGISFDGQGFEPFFVERNQLAVIPASTARWSLSADGPAEIIRILPAGE